MFPSLSHEPSQQTTAWPCVCTTRGVIGSFDASA